MKTPLQLHTLIDDISTRTWEPAYDQYREHLAALNAIVAQSGVPLEGNLFTEHLRPEIPAMPVEGFRNKRSNYALFCATGSSLLEIGFNAGHSCMLALTSNPDLVYTGVDIGMHAYTQPCFEYLRSVFGQRVHLHIGDSREVLPALRTERRTFDIYHLDGGHGFEVAHADLCNLLNFSDAGGPLLVDDTNDHMIAGLCDFYVIKGQMNRVTLRQLWCETIDHELFYMPPKR